MHLYVPSEATSAAANREALVTRGTAAFGGYDALLPTAGTQDYLHGGGTGGLDRPWTTGPRKL